MYYRKQAAYLQTPDVGDFESARLFELAADAALAELQAQGGQAPPGAAPPGFRPEGLPALPQQPPL